MKLRYGLAITLALLFACSDLWAAEVTDGCDWNQDDVNDEVVVFENGVPNV